VFINVKALHPVGPGNYIVVVLLIKGTDTKISRSGSPICFFATRYSQILS
jgi:hypothetical protein